MLNVIQCYRFVDMNFWEHHILREIFIQHNYIHGQDFENEFIFFIANPSCELTINPKTDIKFFGHGYYFHDPFRATGWS